MLNSALLCYRDLLSDVGTVYESTWEAIRHVLDAHPQQNVSYPPVKKLKRPSFRGHTA